VQANVSISGVIEYCCDPQFRHNVLTVLADALGLDPKVVSIDHPAECAQMNCSVLDTAKPPSSLRRSSLSSVLLQVQAILSSPQAAKAWNSADSLSQALSSALNITVDFIGETIDQIATGYVYLPMSADGEIALIGCAAGYLLVNDSVVNQDCIICPPFSYSMDPTDGCRGRPSCPTRPCNKCPSGAKCFGGKNFTTSAGSVWKLTVDAKFEGTLMMLTSCPSGCPGVPLLLLM
jgi:hypothetical protein